MTRNQASGGDNVRVARSHGRRHSAAEARATRVSDCPFRVATKDTRRAGPQPVICVQAVSQSTNGTQSLLPLSHCASGVFQNLIVLK